MNGALNTPWMRWGKRALTLLLLLAISTLLYASLRNLDWGEVRQALSAYSPQTLLLGTLITLASYLLFGGYDLLGQKYSRHHLPARQVLPVAMIHHAFTLNFATWMGSVAMQYRLYMRFGLGTSTVTRILSLGLLTHWTSCMMLAGVIFSLRLIELPANWKLSMTGLQLLGFALLGLVSAYVGICAFSRQRVWHFRERSVTLPSLRIALLQLCLGASNWSLMAALLYWLLPDGGAYTSVLGALLISAMIAFVARVPAGLGVLEAMSLALLQRQHSQSSLIAALITYRVLYYLLPLLVTSAIYLALEKRTKVLCKRSEQSVETLPG